MFILPWHLTLGVDVGDSDGDIMEERLRINYTAIEKVGNVKKGEASFYILLSEKDKYDPPHRISEDTHMETFRQGYHL